LAPRGEKKKLVEGRLPPEERGGFADIALLKVKRKEGGKGSLIRRRGGLGCSLIEKG